VNPKVDTRLAYLNTFDDAAAGREAALAMIRVGVDMLHHNADQAALGLFQAVKRSPDAYAFGANADQSALAPDRVLGSVVIDLPRAFLAIARQVKERKLFAEGGIVRAGGRRAALRDESPLGGAHPGRPWPSWVRAAADSIGKGTLKVGKLGIVGQRPRRRTV
jgi:basic membrane lipoprotein Med (substrate-binding protein (PBP1-ABC) superfamily)